MFKNTNKTRILKIKKYNEICSMYGPHQLINYPTRVPCKTSTLNDHILTNTQKNFLQSGVIDTSISNHSIIYCTTKISKSKMPKTKGINFLVTTKNTQSISIKRSWKELSFRVMKTLMTLASHIMILLYKRMV